MRRDLLHGDGAAAVRRRRDEVEAAVGRFAGERPGEGDDGPESQEDRQEVADAPGQEPAERLDVDGSPSRPWKTGGREVICDANSARCAAVVNSVPYGAPVRSMNRPPTIPTTRAARRLSRRVLP